MIIHEYTDSMTEINYNDARTLEAIDHQQLQETDTNEIFLSNTWINNSGMGGSSDRGDAFFFLITPSDKVGL